MARRPFAKIEALVDQVQGMPCGPPTQWPGGDCHGHTFLIWPGGTWCQFAQSSTCGPGGPGIRGPGLAEAIPAPNPSVVARRSLFTVTLRCLTSSMEASPATDLAASGSSAPMSCRNSSIPRSRSLASVPLGPM